jgi:hypothetical protein
MKFCHSQVNGWNGRTSSEAKLGQKSHVLPHIQIIDLKQMQQYYWTQVTLRGDHAQEG